MTEMCECWVNVARSGEVGTRWNTRERSKRFTKIGGSPVAYLLHIRLKPPGAPKRYAGENERRLWERGLLGPGRAGYIHEKTRERLA